MEIFTLANGPFMVNSYLVVNGKKAFIIDPGSGINPILVKIESEKLELEAIVATHGHIDHIDGVNTVKKKFKVPFYVNDMDTELIQTVQMQARMFGVPDPGEIIADRNLPSSGDIEIAGMKLGLVHTPGHSKGSVSIIIDDVIFSGDTLFNFSIGRTDLPGGNYEELINSIRSKILILPDSTRVLSGHGPETTVGREKKMNPFLS
ncbi:MAG TPA: MBL fold metallo-hydrolase [Spirochaetota bacterium]|nr:MBL fold metallo-hydrolase [Spirochaetota bacterium]HPJ36226.1 MBL fold metallo-hydrolase [Spirochaetota bacterium]